MENTADAQEPRLVTFQEINYNSLEKSMDLHKSKK